MANLIAPFAGARAEAVAARLLERFGSLNRALIATDGDDDVGEDADVLRTIRAARLLVLEAAREDIARRAVSPRDPALHGYLRHLLGGRSHEALHAVFLDAEHGYIADECLAPGTSNAVVASIRHLVARSFDLGARGLILAHNHPSGSALPSEEDITTTARIGSLAASLDLTLIDHLIVTQGQVFSFRKEGLLCGQ